MASSPYVKIEWSGYWDFPSGDYQTGSKIGEPKSGVFPTEDIVLDSTDNAEYEIDPADIGIPDAPSFSFTLKNLNKKTGQQKYSFEYITSIGRTEEYGGKFGQLGDLFIRVSIPLLNDKVIYKGIAKEPSYSIHNREVTIQCESLVESIKNLKTPFWIEMDYESNEVSALYTTTTQIASEVVPGGGITDVRDTEGNSCGLERITFNNIVNKSEKLSEEFSDLYTELEFNHFVIDLRDRSENTWGEKLTGFFNEHIDKIESAFEDTVLQNRYGLFSNDLNFGTGSWQYGSQESTSSGGSMEYTNSFIQIEESTILTMWNASYSVTAYNDDVYEDCIRAISVDVSINVVHANNGSSETIINDDKTVVFERGRFFKEEDNLDDAKIKEGDNVSVKILDWKKIETDDDNVTAIVDYEFSRFGHNSGYNLIHTDKHMIHGISFDEDFDGGDKILVASDQEGYFDNIGSLSRMIETNFLGRFTEGYVNQGELFDISRLDNNRYRHSYVSDLVHYGWDEDVPDALIGMARQVSAYIYIQEDGKIALRPRVQVSTEELLNNSIEIFPEDYEILSGFNYTYGSRYYKIEYNDQLEINNLESDADVVFVIDHNGEVTETIQKPRSLDLSNYRTSDLGVPDQDEIIEDSNQKILRKHPNIAGSEIPEHYFLQNPLDQAVTIAKGIGYPSRLFSIGLDVMYGEAKGYFGINVGSVVRKEKGNTGNYEMFLVKKINYSPKRLRSNSTSIKMELLYMFDYHPPVSESYDESISVSDNQSEEILAPIQESYSDSVGVSDNQSETTNDPNDAPQDLSISQTDPCILRLDWSDVTYTYDHYNIEVSINGDPFTEVDSVPSGTTQYQYDFRNHIVPQNTSVDFTFRINVEESDGTLSGYSNNAIKNGVDTTQCVQ